MAQLWAYCITLLHCCNCRLDLWPMKVGREITPKMMLWLEQLLPPTSRPSPCFTEIRCRVCLKDRSARQHAHSRYFAPAVFQSTNKKTTRLLCQMTLAQPRIQSPRHYLISSFVNQTVRHLPRPQTLNTETT